MMYHLRCLSQKLVVSTEYRFQKQVVIVAMKVPVSQKRLSDKRRTAFVKIWDIGLLWLNLVDKHARRLENVIFATN